VINFMTISVNAGHFLVTVSITEAEGFWMRTGVPFFNVASAVGRIFNLRCGVSVPGIWAARPRGKLFLLLLIAGGLPAIQFGLDTFSYIQRSFQHLPRQAP
jgi:hypothetical protein